MAVTRQADTQVPTFHLTLPSILTCKIRYVERVGEERREGYVGPSQDRRPDVDVAVALVHLGQPAAWRRASPAGTWFVLQDGIAQPQRAYLQ
jgi:hypothetical protein